MQPNAAVLFVKNTKKLLRAFDPVVSCTAVRHTNSCTAATVHDDDDDDDDDDGNNNNKRTNKIAKYNELTCTHIYYPVAIETGGTWNHWAV